MSASTSPQAHRASATDGGLLHDPVNAPRPGTPGEGFYLALWREYVEADARRLDRILRDTRPPEPSPRQAAVCASFMTFMGCNAGIAFTDAAERMVAARMDGVYRSPGHVFLMAWSLENRRRTGMNSGVRIIEAMLAHDLWSYRQGEAPRMNRQAMDAISTDDFDTVDCMVEWWAGEDAAAMRALARPWIQEANRRLLEGSYRRAGKQQRAEA